MVAHAKPPRDVCVPGPAREECRPGDVLGMRLAGTLAADMAKSQPDCQFTPATLIVVAVVREDRLFGWTLAYRVRDVAGNTFTVEPAMVYRIEPKIPLLTDDSDPDDTPLTVSAPEPVTERPLKWVSVAANVERSADGRFEIEADARDMRNVRDLWTGQFAAGIATRYAAVQWCEQRREGALLNWKGGPHGWSAGYNSGAFQVAPAVGGWQATDHRIPAGIPSAGIRGTALFDDQFDAMHWCSIRAACEIVGEPTGAGSLKYIQPIPF